MGRMSTEQPAPRRVYRVQFRTKPDGPVFTDTTDDLAFVRRHEILSLVELPWWAEATPDANTAMNGGPLSVQPNPDTTLILRRTYSVEIHRSGREMERAEAT